jgi:hypothetical protein
VAENLEELAYNLSLSSLAEQESVLKDLRARSATLITASSLVASFIGGRAFDAVGFNGLTIPAMAAFFLTLVAPLYLVSGAEDMRFTMDGPQVYAYFATRGASLDDAYRELAERIQDVRRANRHVTGRALSSLRLGFGALTLEVILFLVALALH